MSPVQNTQLIQLTKFLSSQGCIKLIIKYVGKEYQVLKRGREYHGFGENITWKKRDRGSNVIFSSILRLLGRRSSGKRGSGRKFWGRKSRFKNWDVSMLEKNIKF